MDNPVTFDHDSYLELLGDFRESGYSFQTFGPMEDGDVIVRHDVDLSAERALAMARLEASIGVSTTYCFLLTSPAYRLATPEGVDILSEIAELGHDVALHFDTHYYWEETPDRATLIRKITSELDLLTDLSENDVKTVSFHMPGEWLLGVEFESFENAYAPRYFNDIEYISDSRQKWRDRPPLAETKPDRIQMLVHPGLWTTDGRPMKEIVEELSDNTKRRGERYLDAIHSTIDDRANHREHLV